MEEKTPEISTEEKKKSTKNGFIILGVFGGIIALLVSTAIVGAFAPSLVPQSSKEHIYWANTAPGFYDENKTQIKREDGSGAGAFTIQNIGEGKNIKGQITQIISPDKANTMVMPSMYNSVPVTIVGDTENQNIFAKDCYFTSISKIYFKTNYGKIGKNAFANLENLKMVSFYGKENETMTISEKAFANTGLEEINFASSIKEIGISAFENLSKLKTVNFAKTSLEKIHDFAFSNNTSLTQFSLPNTVVTLGNALFKDSALETLNFNGTKNLWNGRFANSQKAILEGSKVTTIHCIDGDISL